MSSSRRNGYAAVGLRIPLGLLATAVLLSIPATASAVIVDRLAGDFDPAAVNTTAPQTDLLFESTGVEDTDPNTVPGGDPGWHNVPTNRSGIYLGNQWYLDARHAFGGNLQTVNLNGASYSEIPGTRTVLQNVSSFRGIAMTADSDLVLFRLDTNASGQTPEQAHASVKTLDNSDPSRSLTLANTTHAIGDQVLMIGHSNRRVVNTDDADGHTSFSTEDWSVIDPLSPPDPLPPVLEGFQQSTARQKTWGTNIVESDMELEVDVNGNPINDGRFNNDIVVNIAGRHTVSQITRFDPGVGDAQATNGDSGGPVFVLNNNGEWELGGIMHGVSNFAEDDEVEIDGQTVIIGADQTFGSTSISIFGNYTLFTDLGNSLAGYRNQIVNRYDDDYSVMGDVDLDGDVDTDDLLALAEGWNAPSAEAGIVTWKQGDLNQDGDTDLADFALLREQLPVAVTVADLQAAIARGPGVSVIPEPAGGLLALLASGLAATAARRRTHRRCSR